MVGVCIAGDTSSSSEALDEGKGLAQFGEEGFVGFEFAGVDAASETAHLDGMFEMEHFVVEQVLDGVTGA